MPVVSSPTPSTFCWVELQTTDSAAARAFYGEVFGWSIADMPGAVPYAVASVDGSMTAGIVELPAPAKARGAPPNWLSYIAVDDVKASTDKAAALGGRVLMPPTSMGPGTFSVIQDPTGGVFATWHSPQPMGSFLSGESGSLGWVELVSADQAAAEHFYTSLFGWTCDHSNVLGLSYSLFKHASEAVAGMVPMPKAEPPGTPSHWGVYFAVEDADETVADAVARGAQVLLPLMDVPTVGRLGFLADPQGAPFAVIVFEGMAS